MQDPGAIQTLQELGLTGLEAEIYVHLLTSPPLSGYSVAKSLRKPTANVYKALDTLAHKGAVEVEDGNTRLVRAVPQQELLRNLETAFTRRRDAAAASLADLPGPKHDHRIYYLHTLDQVLSKCRGMLEAAHTVVLADVFPASAEMMRDDFEQVAARGVDLVIRSYAPFELAGADIQQTPQGKSIRARWPAQWLNLVVDGEQSIVSVFRNEMNEVVQSFWTASPSLAYLHHAGLLAEIGYSALQNDVLAGRSHHDMRQSIAQVSAHAGLAVPGYTRLITTLGLKQTPSGTDEEDSDE